MNILLVKLRQTLGLYCIEKTLKETCARFTKTKLKGFIIKKYHAMGISAFAIFIQSETRVQFASTEIKLTDKNNM